MSIVIMALCAHHLLHKLITYVWYVEHAACAHPSVHQSLTQMLEPIGSFTVSRCFFFVHLVYNRYVQLVLASLPPANTNYKFPIRIAAVMGTTIRTGSKATKAGYGFALTCRGNYHGYRLDSGENDVYYLRCCGHYW
jgi:hypothetical protein